MGTTFAIPLLSFAVVVTANWTTDQQCAGLLEKSKQARIIEGSHHGQTRLDTTFSLSMVHTEDRKDDEQRRHSDGENHASLTGPMSEVAVRLCSNSQEDSKARRLQDTNCPIDLLQSIQGDEDGFLTVNEYHNFFADRYYRRCDLSDVEIDTSTGTGITVRQKETFDALSCLICLGEIDTPISSLPQCCRSTNAIIPVGNPTVDNFARICEGARATAIEECGYVTIIQTIAPFPTIQSQPSPQIRMTPAPRGPAEPSGGIYQQCTIDLVDSDKQVPDGLLDQSEFMHFLERHFGIDCILRISEQTLSGAFLQLACAWCLSASGASLDCCAGSAARVSISEAIDSNKQFNELNWIARVCSTVSAEIGSLCGIRNPTVPPVMFQPFPVPFSSPIVPPVSFAPIKTPIVTSPSPVVRSMDTTLTNLPGTSSPSYVLPTPDPTLRPPPGNPIAESTAAPVNSVKITSIPVGVADETNAPTQAATFFNSSAQPFATDSPVKNDGPPSNQRSGTYLASTVDCTIISTALWLLSSFRW